MTNYMKIARMATEYIKPSLPTPRHLRNFNLSLLDQLAPSLYASMLFFYPMQLNHAEVKARYRVNHLKQSLSPFLTRFYPFAGRIKDHVSIDCNDAGVGFSEARVNTRLKDFLKQPNANALKHFLPVDIESRGDGDQLVYVQTNTFECGGIGLGISWSHKITDGGTVSTFMRGWSSTASCSGNVVIPEYVASSLFPPMDSSITQHSLKLAMDRTTTRRFVFDASQISELRTRGASEGVSWPTRVEVVSSLLWKCATKASRANTKTKPLSVMSQSMNIRKRTSPPLPDTTIGNLVGYYIAKIEDDNNNNNNNISLSDLVAKQRQGKTEAINNYAKKLQGKDAYSVIRELFKEAGTLLRRDDVDFYKCLSTCGDGLYDADFGFGKPIWNSLVSLGYKNTFALNQTREDGGIEAWVTLTEDDMAVFERDLELLAFASPNPSVITMNATPELLTYENCQHDDTMLLTW